MQHQAIIAVHDVAPGWEPEIVAIMSTLSETVPSARPALLVVPNFHGAAPLEKSTSFLRRLRQWTDTGSEPILHGFFHRAPAPVSLGHPIRWTLAQTLTDGEGEFLDLEPMEITRRLTDGRKQLETLLGCPVSGFVPPAWLRNRALIPALHGRKFHFTEGHVYIHDLLGKRRLCAPALTFSGRTPARAAASCRFANALLRAPLHRTDLRLAIHPADWTVLELRERITALARHIGETHRLVSYEEMLQS